MYIHISAGVWWWREFVQVRRYPDPRLWTGWGSDSYQRWHFNNEGMSVIYFCQYIHLPKVHAEHWPLAEDTLKLISHNREDAVTLDNLCGG